MDENARQTACKRGHIVRALFALLFLSTLFLSAEGRIGQDAARPGARSLMDAHNCYPYFEWWPDRIDRALSSGTPLAIEQDLYWYTDPRTGHAQSVLTHGSPVSGNEPTMREYFFERVRPIVEEALREGNRRSWPLITLNLDLKSEEPEHLAAIWNLLSEYQDWISTATRSADIHRIEPLDVKPILVLSGQSEAQKGAFYDQLPVGSKLFVFGAVPTNLKDSLAKPEILEPNPADNYHRWWNNPWNVVEAGGPAKAGPWTTEKMERLTELVSYAHKQGLWIRFYTLDGATPAELSCHGWFRGYNFGSRAAVDLRWRAAVNARVDYIATDQYEDLGAFLRNQMAARVPH
jgi:hypothetical protein